MHSIRKKVSQYRCFAKKTDILQMGIFRDYLSRHITPKQQLYYYYEIICLCHEEVETEFVVIQLACIKKLFWFWQPKEKATKFGDAEIAVNKYTLYKTILI